MEKEVRASLRRMSFEHLRKEFHSANRLPGAGVWEAWESRPHPDIPERDPVIFHILGLLSRRCDSVDVEIKLLCRKLRKTWNTDIS